MGTKNKLIDLNNHLFEQMERLNDDKLTGEALQQEIKRGEAMAGIATQIIENAKVTVMAARIIQRDGGSVEVKDLPTIFDTKQLPEGK